MIWKSLSAHDAAGAMLDAFASVGAASFDVTVTTRQGIKVEFRRGVPAERLRCALPAHLDASAKYERNVIVRPRGGTAMFVQLDDLTLQAIKRVRTVSFLGLETSLRNYQAWIAVKHGGEDLARQLRRSTYADTAASGAARVAGSSNFKDRYAPEFPRIEILFVSPGLIVGKEELAALGVLSEPSAVAGPPPHRPPNKVAASRKWPSYQRCVDGAPAARDGNRPDISRADFTWCMIAIDWGWSVDTTAARLMEESHKARDNGERYAIRTARAAASALDLNRLK